MIIGITDTYLDIAHPDLATKYVSAVPNVIDPHLTDTGLSHGTHVAGLAAASTDTSTGSPFYGGYPGIGFQCKIDFSCLYNTSEMHKISTRPGRRVLNGSWITSYITTILALDSLLTEQQAYQEIYENGVFSCFAAGNSIVSAPYQYAYPASLDYVFSVSGVNHVNTTGTYNVKGMHEGILGDSMHVIGFHNPRVDLLAPYNDIGGLTYYPLHSVPTWQHYTPNAGWGTSYASPLVAGTAALILSVDKCYTPYQLEYILKKSANADIFTLPENTKYAGRIGAGRLDAGMALAMVDSQNTNPFIPFFGCNDSATTTFYIEGLDINTICAPGYSSNGAVPKLTPILRNGKPAYTYRWEYLPGNNVILSSLSAANPTITASTGNRKAMLRLTVYDGSPVQKVATRKFAIQLSTANTYDLAVADSYMDMFNEPNLMDSLDRRDNNFYTSPDIWNRQHNDGLPDHENPEYFNNAPNYVNFRIRNVGCAASPATNRVKLYWTVASTGENWPSDWNGTATTFGQPCGGEITPGQGMQLLSIQPGSGVSDMKAWYPPKPQNYFGKPKNLHVCLLARIIDTADLIKKGMTIAEVGGPVITNVRNNNNIVTRNLWVTNLNTSNKGAVTRAYIGNAGTDAAIFDVQFINDKAINLHFAGNFSAIGHVTLYLGDLYDIWMDAGGQGSYLERNDEEKSVTMDGSQTLELLGVPLDGGSKYPVDVEFSLYPNAVIPDYRYDFHLRQFEITDEQRSPDVYGSMSFRINTESDKDVSRRAGNNAGKDMLIPSESGFAIYPNPVSTNLTLTYLGEDELAVNLDIYDVTGRKMLHKEDQYFKNSRTDLDVSGFVPGVYFLTITNSKGANERFKFVKE